MFIFNLDLDGLSYYTTKMKQYIEDKIVNKVDKVSGKGLSTNDLTNTLKNNYDSAYTHSTTDHAPSNAQANQNAFSNIAVGSTTIAADTTTDTLTLVGSNVTITPDATNDKVTIGITKANVTDALGYTPPTTNTTYGVATSSALGLVKSGADIEIDGTGLVNVLYAYDSQISQTAIKLVDTSGNLLDVGSVNTPVYFNGGIPEACTSVMTSANFVLDGTTLNITTN